MGSSKQRLLEWNIKNLRQRGESASAISKMLNVEYKTIVRLINKLEG